MEVDGLVIALARLKQADIKSKLASMKRSRTVFQAYQNKCVLTQHPWVNGKM